MNRLLGVILAAALAFGAADRAVAALDVSAAGEQSRLALRDGQYARVIELTQQIAQVDATLPLNWYRMAIAASRSQQYTLAHTAISRAEALDPLLRFATTPGHVERLKANIRAGLESDLLAKAQAPALSLVAGSLPPGPAGDAADPAATGQAVQTALTAVAGKLERLDESVKAATAAAAERDRRAADSAFYRLAPWVVGFVLLGTAVLAGATVYYRRSLQDLRQARADRLAAMPLDDLLRYSTDAASALQQRLKLHNHQDKDLFVQLSRVLPALERESGRSKVDVAKVAGTVPVADTTRELRPKDPVLGQVDPRKLHSSAAAAALGAAARLSLQPPAVPEARKAA